MPASIKSNITWYTDRDALERGESGISHSYVAAVATALNHLHRNIDPVWLMGSSAFAFRIIVSKMLCPSAMSVFNWCAILPEAVEQLGHHCTYISRLWGEDDIEEELEDIFAPN